MDIEAMCAEALEELVERIAAQVAARIREQQTSVLVVYTGAKIGCAEATVALRSLHENHGFTFKVLMSERAAQVLDVDAIDGALEPTELWVGEPSVPAEQLAREADTIVVPALTANTCAHVVQVMTDTPAQAAILEGLQLGRNVVVAVDGCCPDNAERAKLGFVPAPALAARMRANRDALRDYGAVLTTAENLGRKVLRSQAKQLERLFGAGASAAPAQSQTPAAGTLPASQARFEGRLLDASYVRSLAAGSTLTVAPGTLVTQLARDVARTAGIQITQER